MKTYMLIGKTTNSVVSREVKKLARAVGKTTNSVVSREVKKLARAEGIIKNFVNNPIIKSAILIEVYQKKAKISMLKGALDEFKDSLDQEFNNGWEEDKKLITLTA
ncbi:MAG: hypothetical protein PHH83_02430 [Patescibacteria group bacterium]|nr:hypothetical protein [Patescibacteria group bacterium]